MSAPRIGTRGPIPKTLAERLAAKTRWTNDGCLEWTGYVNSKGYAQMIVGSTADGTRRGMPAHRVAWEVAFGPVPEGLGLCVCHACDNPACCNPNHLLLGTKEANNVDMFRKQRGVSFFASEAAAGRHPRWPANRTHCSHGHVLDAENTYVNPRGQRLCRICRRTRHAEFRRLRKIGEAA